MRIYQQRYTRNGVTHISQTWRVSFRHHGRERSCTTGTKSKLLAKDIARRIERIIESSELDIGLTRSTIDQLRSLPPAVTNKLVEWNILPPEYASTVAPLTDYLDRFKRHLLTRGTTKAHADQTKTRALTVIEIAGFSTYHELCESGATDTVDEALAKLSDDGASDQTVAHYLRAIKQFCRWMHERKRLPESPIMLIERSGKMKLVHQRRSLTIEEFQRLILAARDDEPVAGMDGVDWALLYWLAATTGLDRSTLKRLNASHIRFVGVAAVVTMKRPKTEALITPWITDPALVDALRQRVSMTTPGTPLFQIPKYTARVVRRHLQAAGIDYRDGAGRVFDFHAIRRQFSTVAQDAGVNVKSVQQAFGHASSKTTTEHYTDATEKSLRQLADAMPRLNLDDDRPHMFGS